MHREHRTCANQGIVYSRNSGPTPAPRHGRTPCAKIIPARKAQLAKSTCCKILSLKSSKWQLNYSPGDACALRWRDCQLQSQEGWLSPGKDWIGHLVTRHAGLLAARICVHSACQGVHTGSPLCIVGHSLWGQLVRKRLGPRHRPLTPDSCAAGGGVGEGLPLKKITKE